MTANKIMFGIWGGLGFAAAILSLLTVPLPQNAILIWIGGMLFFGIAAIINRPL